MAQEPPPAPYCPWGFLGGASTSKPRDQPLVSNTDKVMSYETAAQIKVGRDIDPSLLIQPDAKVSTPISSYPSVLSKKELIITNGPWWGD